MDKIDVISPDRLKYLIIFFTVVKPTPFGVGMSVALLLLCNLVV